MTTYELPIRLESEMNLREHWAKRYRRKKMQQHAALMIGKHELPCTVRIIRFGPKPLDGDNMQASAKFLRDAIAARLGVDDADERVQWRYDQRRGPHGVIVEIEPQP